MLSEQREFISAFQEPTWRPMNSGRFWFLLLLLCFFSTKEEKNETHSIKNRNNFHFYQKLIIFAM